MMATNGLLWTEEKARAILSAGIDFIKIQLSGYTQDIYSVQIRYGNVEKLKDNIRMLARVNEEEGYKAVIMLDYILYNYNRHQLDLVKEFCKELGVMLNIRPGNPNGGLEDKEPPPHPQPLPLKISCDWLWKGMQVNWNGGCPPALRRRCLEQVSAVRDISTGDRQRAGSMERADGPKDAGRHEDQRPRRDPHVFAMRPYRSGV